MEHHAKTSDIAESVFTDGRSHLFTLIIRHDNSYRMLLDSAEVNSGTLLNDLNPPINPPKKIVDPNDKRPENWDVREKIPDNSVGKPDYWDESQPRQILDVNAKKPTDWLENEQYMIPDPEADKPNDWNSEADGEWVPPKIENPKCDTNFGCGKWSPPLIDNPEYRGKWVQPMILNPKNQGVWEPKKSESGFLCGFLPFQVNKLD